MDKKQLYSLSLEIRRLLNKKLVDEAKVLISQVKLNQNEFDFVKMCLCSYDYDYRSDSFSIAHGDNLEFLKLVEVIMKSIEDKKLGG